METVSLNDYEENKEIFIGFSEDIEKLLKEKQYNSKLKHLPSFSYIFKIKTYDEIKKINFSKYQSIASAHDLTHLNASDKYGQYGIQQNNLSEIFFIKNKDSFNDFFEIIITVEVPGTEKQILNEIKQSFLHKKGYRPSCINEYFCIEEKPRVTIGLEPSRDFEAGICTYFCDSKEGKVFKINFQNVYYENWVNFTKTVRYLSKNDSIQYPSQIMKSMSEISYTSDILASMVGETFKEYDKWRSLVNSNNMMKADELEYFFSFYLSPYRSSKIDNRRYNEKSKYLPQWDKTLEVLKSASINYYRELDILLTSRIYSAVIKHEDEVDRFTYGPLKISQGLALLHAYVNAREEKRDYLVTNVKEIVDKINTGSGRSPVSADIFLAELIDIYDKI